MGAVAVTEGAKKVIDRRRERKPDHPKEFLGLQCPKELTKKAREIGRTKTEGVIRLLDIAADAFTEATKDDGSVWFQLQVYASQNGITEGEALGRLALEALKKGKR